MRVAPAAALAMVALSAACRFTSADEQLLIAFFDRSRVYDRTRLAEVSTVVFNPATEGVVHRFEIVEGGPEKIDPAGRRTRAVSILAAVIPPEGAPAERRLVVTLTQLDGRWMVTDVQPLE